MLRLFSSLLMLLAAMSASAQSPGDAYFCTAEGARLHYERTEAGDGSLRWSHVMTIDSVKGGDSSAPAGVSDGLTVEYNSLFTKPGGGRMYGGPVSMSVRISPNGDVHMDVAQAVAAVFANMFGAKKVRSTGAETVLPASMKAGDTLKEAKGSVTAGPASMRVDVTRRKVLRSESLTTPAGTFDCVVVQEHKVEKGTFRNRVTTAQTWYARGVGMVRHDTYDKNMVLDTSEVLVKIENK